MFNNVLYKPVKLRPNTSTAAKDLIMGVSLVIRAYYRFSLEESVCPGGALIV